MREVKPDSGGGELTVIRQIRSRATQRSARRLRVGIGDDCAIMRVRPGEELAVTTDLSIAGRHFLLDEDPAEAVGHRTLARGLSDLAAMGARPAAAFLSLGLPRELTLKRGRRAAWVERFFDGLLALAEAHRTPLAGGDLAEAPVAMADIVLVGAVPRGRALLRSGARPGDLLYVTGSLGGAAVGLEQLRNLAADTRSRKKPLSIPKAMQAALAPHLFPQPRLAQGFWLQKRGIASAAIDLSDGISTDLAHLCEESDTAAELDAAALPVASRATLEQALHGGEDYELLFSAGASTRVPQRISGVPVTCIGRIVRRRKGGPTVTIKTAEANKPLEPHGWQHFS
jgi:thiamine-monophosphate kinase